MRRARAAEAREAAAAFEPPHSPVALYRAEKARRAANVETAHALADAKRIYDEAVAETAKKRAGMRSAVVPPSQRRAAMGDEPDE